MSQPKNSSANKESKQTKAPELKIPNNFRCPISSLIMLDPVITADGHTYEHETIEIWLKDHDTSPMTNERLAHKNLTLNIALKGMIGDFLDEHPEIWDSEEIYQITALKENLVKAIADGAKNEINRILTMDRRLLIQPLQQQKTLLQLVLEQKSAEIVKLVVERLGNKIQSLPEVKNDRGVKLFQQTTAFGSEIALLVGNALGWQAKDYQQQFWFGVNNNRAELVQLCLELKADPNEMNDTGLKAIHVASAKEQKELMALLAKYNQIDNVDAKGNTALHLAIANNRLSQVQLLLGCKASTEKVDAKGQHPLELSIAKVQEQKTSLAIAEELLQHNANPNLINQGYSLLLRMLNAGERDIVALLIRYNADVNLAGPNGELSILEAFKYGTQAPELLDLLLVGGAAVETKDSKGLTSLLKAVNLGLEEAVAVLIHHGADLKATDSQSNTALHLAVARGLDNTVKLLLQQKIDTKLRNSAGQTARKVALLAQNNVIAELISAANFAKRMEPLQQENLKLQQEILNLHQEMEELKLEVQQLRQTDDYSEIETTPDWQAKIKNELGLAAYEAALAAITTANNILEREVKHVDWQSVYKIAQFIDKNPYREIFTCFCDEKEIKAISDIQQKLFSWQKHAVEKISYLYSPRKLNANWFKIIKSYYSSLTYLDLIDEPIGAEGAKILAAALPQSRITYLSLRKNEIGETGAKSLAIALPQSRITDLNLENNKIGDEGANSLAIALPQSRIAYLNLESNQIGDEGAKILAAALPQSRITYLSLGKNEIGETGAKSLAIALPQSRITNLDLYCNKIGVEGAKSLAAALPQSRITNLNLHNNNIGAEGAKNLAAVLPQSRITDLSLSRNNIGAEGAKSLATALPQSRITILYLYDNNIGDEEAKNLAAALTQSRITNLDLNYNTIGAEGVKSLAAALPQSRITDLNLHSNNIGAEGAKSLAAALPQSRITNLNLGQNKIGDEGAKSLAAALPHSRITNLYLDYYNIGDEGAKSLAAALPQSRITNLDLNYNKIGAEGAKSLASAVAKMRLSGKTIKVNILDENTINQEMSKLREEGFKEAKAASIVPNQQLTFFTSSSMGSASLGSFASSSSDSASSSSVSSETANTISRQS